MYQRKQEELAAVQRDKELRDFVALKDYVNERSKVFRRRQLQMQHVAAQEECDRVERRLNDRSERRARRFESFLDAERALMAFEDSRSYAARFLFWERAQALREREDMAGAEAEQREVGDGFWGLDLYERNFNAEERRLRQVYCDRVIEANRRLHAVRATAPVRGRTRARSVHRGPGVRRGTSSLFVLSWHCNL